MDINKYREFLEINWCDIVQLRLGLASLIVDGKKLQDRLTAAETAIELHIAESAQLEEQETPVESVEINYENLRLKEINTRLDIALNSAIAREQRLENKLFKLRRVEQVSGEGEPVAEVLENYSSSRTCKEIDTALPVGTKLYLQTSINKADVPSLRDDLHHLLDGLENLCRNSNDTYDKGYIRGMIAKVTAMLAPLPPLKDD